jgi:hypothetical protein
MGDFARSARIEHELREKIRGMGLMNAVFKIKQGDPGDN